MNNFLKRNLNGDLAVWMIYFFLCIISVVEMFSASSHLVSRSGSISGPIMKHITFLVLGFVLLYITHLVHFKYLRMLGYLGLASSIILLIYTSLFGITQAGAARFINISGVQFQPSELAKLSLLIVVADIVDRSQDPDMQKKLFKWMAIAVYTVCLLIFTENFSTAFLLGMVSFLIMFIGGISAKRLAVFVLIPVVFVVMIMGIASAIPEENYTADNIQNAGKVESVFFKVFGRAYTWKARIEHFSDSKSSEEKFSTKSQYQLAHAEIAISRGGFLGVGPGNSVQRNFLPEAYSDFIFAIIIEEGGLLMGIFVIFLYLWLLMRAGIVARKSKTVFSAVLVIGVTMMVVFQAFIHMGVCAHVGPVTGQPLPLISKGGTSILVTSVYFGIILGVTRNIQREENADAEKAASVSENAPEISEPVKNDANEGDENIEILNLDKE